MVWAAAFVATLREEDEKIRTDDEWEWSAVTAAAYATHTVERLRGALPTIEKRKHRDVHTMVLRMTTDLGPC